MNAQILELPDRWTDETEVPDGYLTSRELIHRTGVTYRQLDYWTRTGLITSTNTRGSTPGSGYWRLYPTSEAARVGAIKALLDAGLSLQTIRHIVDQVVETGTVRLGRGDHTVGVHLLNDL